MTRLSQIIFVLSLFFISACNWNTHYDEQISLEHNKWFKGSAARFNVEIEDSLATYDFYINIRNTTTYRYSNLYLFISTRFPNGNISRDTVEFILADDAGKWFGKGWGTLKDNSIQVNQGLRFPLSGEYEFLIQQAMREDTLSGISNIGITLTASE